jgi:SAM-dependent methyltransferase
MKLLRERQKTIAQVLDLGCGDGKNMAWLVENKFIAIGVDASLSALERCEQFLMSRGARKGQYKLYTADVRRLDRSREELLADAAIPAAICIDVLGHQPDPEMTLAELHRVLKPGGVACVSLFHPDDEVRTLRETSGTSRAVMEEKGGFDYEYYPDRDGEPERRYFFRFYDEARANALLRDAGFKVLQVEQIKWSEPDHPGYRQAPHKHCSWFLTVEKPA